MDKYTVFKDKEDDSLWIVTEVHDVHNLKAIQIKDDEYSGGQLICIDPTCPDNDLSRIEIINDIPTQADQLQEPIVKEIGCQFCDKQAILKKDTFAHYMPDKNKIVYGYIWHYKCDCREEASWTTTESDTISHDAFKTIILK